MGEDEVEQPQDRLVVETFLERLEQAASTAPQMDPEAHELKGKFLDWIRIDKATISGRLSQYAKWLIALDLLFSWQPALSVKEALPGKRKVVDRLSYEDGASKTFAQEREQLFRWVHEELSKELKARGSRKLKLQEFLAHVADLQPGSMAVGAQPIRRFREWLIHRHQIPNPGVASSIELSSTQQDLIKKVISAADSDSGRVVINLVSRAEAGLSPALAQALAHTCQAAAAAKKEPFLPVRVSLRPGEARLHVLQSLRKQICKVASEDSRTPDADIDLNNDLLAIRQVLTHSRVLLIFEEWVNSSGPFASLRDFLCDTEWSELIRCLAHPCYQEDASKPNLNGAFRNPIIKSRIVVISTSEVMDIKPWSIQLPEKLEDSSENSPSLPIDSQQAVSASYDKDGTWRPGAYDHSAVHRAYSKSEFADESELDWYAPLALKLIVASVNGIRRQTLLRLLKEWTTLHTALPHGAASVQQKPLSIDRARSEIEKSLRAFDDPASFHKFVDRLLEKYADLLVETRGEQAPGLSSPMRDIGIDRKPELKNARKRNIEEALTLQVKTLALNAVAIDVWLGDEARISREAVSTGAKGVLEANLGSWAHTNYLLCVESLRQATGQMRYGSYSDRESPRHFRRLIQCIFHGLSCAYINVKPALNSGFLAGGPYRPSVPLEASRRFRYLYSFIYRHCVEDDDWRLGRSFGRSDLRLDILSLFVQPKLSPQVLGSRRNTELEVIPKAYEVEHPEMPSDDPHLRCDLLEALGRAALDAGGSRGWQAAEWALSVLPGWKSGVKPGQTHARREEHRINQRLPMRGAVYQRYANAALKLRLDLMLSTGDIDQLRDAGELCDEQLSRLGIDPTALGTLSMDVHSEVGKALDGLSGVTAGLSDALEKAYEKLRKRSSDYAELIFTSDILFRVAEVRALMADVVTPSEGEDPIDVKNPMPVGGTLSRFAESCALYWLADRFRVEAGFAANVGYNWPHAGARSTQYYVRVCHKFARMLRASANGAINNRVSRLTIALLDLAHDRLGLFTRHHFSFARERAIALLLELGHSRSWIRISVEQFYEGMKEKYIKADDEFAKASLVRSSRMQELTQLQNGNSPPKNYNQAKIDEWEKNQKRNIQNAARAKDDAIEVEKRLKSNLVELEDEYLNHIRIQQETLAHAIRNFTQAEAIMLSLGFQANQVRNLYLERAKLVSTGAKLLILPEDNQSPSPQARESVDKLRANLTRALKQRFTEANGPEAFQIGWASLDALSAVSKDDKFWEAIHERQKTNLTTLAVSFDLPVPA